MKNSSKISDGGVYILTDDSVSQLAADIASMIIPALAGALPNTPISEEVSVSDFVAAQDKLISKAQACNILGRCDSTLTKWSAAGKLTPVRRGGLIYFRAEEVMKVYRGEK